MSQFWAMFMKVIYVKSNTWWVFLIQLILPAAWLLINLETSRDSNTSIPPLSLNLDRFNDQIVFMDGDIKGQLAEMYELGLGGKTLEHEKNVHSAILKAVSLKR